MLKNHHKPTGLFTFAHQPRLRFEPPPDRAHLCAKTRSRGRPSTPVEIILRMLAVMRLYR